VVLVSEVPLYDVAGGLAAMRRYRTLAGADPLARESVRIADQLAFHLRRHFPDPSDAAIAGTGLILGVASVGVLADCPTSVAMIQIAGLAGQQLVEGTTSDDQ
jgi:hypothetical protein